MEKLCQIGKGKTLINTGWSLNGQKCVYQRALGMASTIESEIGKNP